MHGLTAYITDCAWADGFTPWYGLVDAAYQAVVAQHGRLRQRGPSPTFSDSEVITIALITDTFFHGKEELCLAFVRQYHADMFPPLLDDPRVTRRRRALSGLMEAMRRIYTTWLLTDDDSVRVVDSAPIPVCTYMRSRSCTTVAGADYGGVMVSRRAKLFGVRLHLSTTPNQVLDQWMLAPAAHHDGRLTPALLDDAAELWGVGDNAFHNPAAMAWLQQHRAIRLVALPRRTGDQVWPKPLRRQITKVRRTIERALSVLCTVFHGEQLGARSVAGVLSRSTTRLFAYTLAFSVGAFLPTLGN